MPDFFHYVLECKVGCVGAVSVGAGKIQHSAVCEDRASSAQNSEGGRKANELGVIRVDQVFEDLLIGKHARAKRHRHSVFVKIGHLNAGTVG